MKKASKIGLGILVYMLLLPFLLLQIHNLLVTYVDAENMVPFF